MKSHIFASHFNSIVKYFDSIGIYFTIAMTGITWALGGWDNALKVLIGCIAIDVITGMIRAFIVDKKFSSRRLRQGIATKVGYLLVILLCHLLDMVFFTDSPVLRTASVWFYIYVEGTSIIENLGNLGVPIPQFLVNRMEQIEKEVSFTAKFGKGKFKSSDTDDLDEILKILEKDNKEK